MTDIKSELTSHEPRLRLAPWQPHSLVYWLAVVWFISGAVQFGQLVIENDALYPTATVFGLLAWALYALPWVLLLVNRELFASQSGRTALFGFLWGGMIATWVIALHGNAAIIGIIAKVGSVQFATDWGAALAAPITEETAKGLGLIMIMLLARQRLRSPMEGLLLGAFVGLGFQVFENWLYTVTNAAQTFGQDESQSIVSMLVSRGLISGLWSHTMYTAIVGAGIGYLVSRRIPHHTAKGLGLILLSLSMHGFWDSPILAELGMAAAFIKAIPALFIYLIAYRGAKSDEGRSVRLALEPEVDRGTISPEDLEVASSSHRARKKHWKKIRKARGKDAGRAERNYLTAIIDLATALDSSGGQDSPEVEFARGEVERLRPQVEAGAAA